MKEFHCIETLITMGSGGQQSPSKVAKNARTNAGSSSISPSSKAAISNSIVKETIGRSKNKTGSTDTANDSMNRGGVSLTFFMASLLIGAVSSYSAGKYYRASILVNNDSQARTARPAEWVEIMNEADFTRQTVRVVDQHQTCEAEECRAGSSSRTVVLETIEMEQGEEFGQFEYDNAEPEKKEDPTGISVMLDIDRLDPNFLGNTKQIRETLLEIIWDTSRNRDLAMESMVCQDRSSKAGVYCFLRLEDGHKMSLSTWPERGVLLLDIFWAGEEFLLPMIKLLKLKFADGRIRWNHILRGSRTNEGRWKPLEHDITELLLEVKNQFHHKREIGTLQSPFQRVDVWEALHQDVDLIEGFEKSSTAENNYFTQNPELFSPTRMLYLDGVMQSSSRGDESYHETLVHPAMFAHAEGPKRVAIIGGGEGATLREVLKHKSVEQCKMIEIDPGMVKGARDWLPAWNDCSSFGEGNCFDEPRTDLLLEDAFGWFMNRFSKTKVIAEEMKEEHFDVIIMDALDPEDQVEFAIALYRNEEFWGSLHEALTDDGILVMQLGESPKVSEYGEHIGIYKNRAALFRTVQKAGFGTFHIYEESHCDFKNPWSFLVACKSNKCSEQWRLNEAQINLRAHERILRTHDGALPLHFFDGDQMRLYQVPSRAWETVFCRTHPVPKECEVIAPGRPLASNATRLSLQIPSMTASKSKSPAVMEYYYNAQQQSPCQNATKLSPVRDRHQHLVLDFLSSNQLC